MICDICVSFSLCIVYVDQLPEGFSQTLSHTEDKKRARFEETESWQAETKPPVPAPTLVNRQQPLAQVLHTLPLSLSQTPRRP